MAKGLVKLAVILAVVCAVAYFGANMLLEAFSQQAFDYVLTNINISNLKLTRPTFQGVGISSFNAVTWRGIAMAATIVRNEILGKVVIATINIDAMTLKVANIAEGIVILELKGLSAAGQESSSEPTASVTREATDRMEKGDISIQMRLRLSNPREAMAQLRDLSSEMKKFSEDGKTAIPIKFSAEETFEVKGKSCTMKIWVEPKGNEYRLVADKDDITRISKEIVSGNQTSSPADIEVIARNPIRAPQLLRIRDKASNTARLAHEANPSVSEDAYRHTLWSYLLTKAYGEEFAKEVTDAHEQTMDAEEMHYASAEASHNQDYNNNAVGRRYARLGYDESSILERVMTDPEVIRDDQVR